MGNRSKSHMPCVHSIRKICKGNMHDTHLGNVESIRRNITVHGGSSNGSDAVSPVKEEEREGLGWGDFEEVAVKEVERLRNHVRKDLKARMLELSTNNEREAVYSSVRESKSSDDVILVETTRERSIRKACKSLALHMIDRICNSFPAYEGNRIHSHPELETAKLTVILNCLNSPPLLLQAIAAHTLRLKTVISKEIERMDVRGDAETLSVKTKLSILEIFSSYVSSPLSYQFNGNGMIATDTHSKGTNNHADTVSSHYFGGGTSQNVRNLMRLELDVWGKERDAAGLKASLNTLVSEIQGLSKLCAERKETEHSLKQKWKKIEEFDARRSELETIYTTLLKANMDAAAFWNQQPLAAREYEMATIISACEVVADISKNSEAFIEKEVSALFQSPDNTFYMLPATLHALLESMGANGSTRPEAVTAAEKNAALLTARSISNPFYMPHFCRPSVSSG
ncbi:hypothetical protein Bca52824_019522 [Brassica carinata]|uniref:Uncharacterized protein n=1 Tax=Brassica carinata TaxID=52824 RepID=A0A8X7VS96_BRACI|nr:hypothetical protein Bca52824_019522 [Brassica carinata]